jgi:hypothetical protein
MTDLPGFRWLVVGMVLIVAGVAAIAVALLKAKGYL